MHEPFTYVFLGTIAGSAAATALIVEIIKDIKLLKHFRIRWLAIIVAEAVTILTVVFNEQFVWNNLFLHLLNGLLAASVAMAGRQITENKMLINKGKNRESD